MTHTMNHLVLLFVSVLAFSSLFMASSDRSEEVTAIVTVDSEEDVAVALAEHIAYFSEKYIKEKDSFSLVLSGGSLIYTLRKLLEPPYDTKVDYSKWLVFWVDERVVPLDDRLSNYKLALDGFLSKVPILNKNIYPINYISSPNDVAIDYESRLRKLVEQKTIPLSATTGFPKFDLILLGIGPDGHVASLFPDRPQRYEKNRWVTFIADSPKPPPARITMTLPVINSASQIAMVVTGKEEAHAVAVAIDGDVVVTPTLPCAEVAAEEVVTWFLDKDAASELKDGWK